MCLGKRTRLKSLNPITQVDSPLHLNISYWNIHGFKSRILGNKLIDPDFLSEIKNSDIIGLGETHAYDEIVDHLNIPGFSRLKCKNRKKRKNNTASGGISVFVKENMRHLFHPVDTKNDDIIWLKIKKENMGLSEDIYLGTSYISPHEGKKEESVKMENLAEDIINFKRAGGLFYSKVTLMQELQPQMIL